MTLQSQAISQHAPVQSLLASERVRAGSIALGSRVLRNATQSLTRPLRDNSKSVKVLDMCWLPIATEKIKTKLNLRVA